MHISILAITSARSKHIAMYDCGGGEAAPSAAVSFEIAKKY